MTEKESIKIEKYLLDGYKKPNYKLAEKIMEAVEKQIPKKVGVNKNYSNGRYTIAFCPTCKDVLGLLRIAKYEIHNCCSKCGQALDWSDTDEQNDR